MNLETERIATGAGPEGLAVDLSGNVWAAVTGQDEIVTIAGLTNEVLQRIPAGDEPRRMLFDDDHLWVTNTGDGTVSVPQAPILE